MLRVTISTFLFFVGCGNEIERLHTYTHICLMDWMKNEFKKCVRDENDEKLWTNFLTSDTGIKRSTLQRVNSIELQFIL